MKEKLSFYFENWKTVPNLISFIRILLIPVFAVLFYNGHTVAAAVILALSGLSDLIDGKIARKRGLVTDFGKFMDPLADKFMVIGAMLCIFYTNSVANNKAVATLYFVTLVVVIFRELAVTSIRLVANSSSGVVIAANWMGKVKTVTQIVCIVAVLLEPLLISVGLLPACYLLSYITIVAMTVMTLWSGIDYMKAYWPLLDPSK